MRASTARWSDADETGATPIPLIAPRDRDLVPTPVCWALVIRRTPSAPAMVASAPGLGPDRSVNRCHDHRRPALVRRLVLFYLREIGAERFVVFAPKSFSFCQEHWQQHARDLGLAMAFDESQYDKTVRKIVKTSEFIIREGAPDGWHATITGRYFEQPVYSMIYRRALAENQG
jgi:hypothetical protein